jgi:hypothetical protein
MGPSVQHPSFDLLIASHTHPYVYTHKRSRDPPEPEILSRKQSNRAQIYDCDSPKAEAINDLAVKAIKREWG